MIKEPESMEELCYFSNRDLDGGKGRARAWVYRGMCPECGKGKMGKPINSKTGKAKIRAKEYECPECHFVMDKEEYEDTLECEIIYKCPSCGFEGETAVPFKRKKVQLLDEETQKKKSVDAVIFVCEKCKTKIPLTKKMKE